VRGVRARAQRFILPSVPADRHRHDEDFRQIEKVWMCWWKCSPIWRRALVQPGRYHLLPCTFYRGRARGFVLRVYTPPLKSGGRTRRA
jgi:hypothetical protein